MASCYILYSESIDRYYVGSTTLPVEDRLVQHNEAYYDRKWTAHGVPWVLYLAIPCDAISQAIAIEKHIKQMKSRTYYQNLKKYPEMILKLKSKYSGPEC